MTRGYDGDYSAKWSGLGYKIQKSSENKMFPDDFSEK